MIANEFKELSWEKFEEICLSYITTRFDPARTGLEQKLVRSLPNTGNSHGGYDAAVYFTHPEFGKKLWFEFKHHSRNLGLEVLGKYAVLVDLNEVDRMIILSASDVSLPAQVQFTMFMERHNRRIEIIAGTQLVTELLRYRNSIDLPFDTNNCPNKENTIALRAFISENPHPEDGSIQWTDNGCVQLRRSSLFYIHLLVENHFPDKIYSLSKDAQSYFVGYLTSLGVSCEKREPYFFQQNQQNQNPTWEISPRESRAISFLCGKSSARGKQLVLGTTQLVFSDRQGHKKNATCDLPTITIPEYMTTPLAGSKHRAFLATEFPKAIQQLRNKQSSIIYLKGISGTGKSRLMHEMWEKLNLQGFMCIIQDGETDSSISFLRRLLVRCLGFGFGAKDIQYNKDALRYSLEQAGLPNDFAKHIHACFTKELLSKKDVYKITQAVRFLIRRCCSKNSITILLDNVQDLEPTATEILLEIVDFLRETDLPCLLCIAVNTSRLASANSSLNSVIHRIESLARIGGEQVIMFEVPMFDDDDIREFLVRSIGLAEVDNSIVSLLTNKIGRRVYDLDIFLRYLLENGIIELDDTGFWLVPDIALFSKALREAPDDLKTVLQRRLNALIITHLGEEILRSLAIMILFWERISSYHLRVLGVSAEVESILISRGYIKEDHSGCHVCFDHTILRNFLHDEPHIRAKLPDVSKSVIDVLKTPDPKIPPWQQARIRCHAAYHGAYSQNEFLLFARKAISLLEKERKTLDLIQTSKLVSTSLIDSGLQDQYIEEYIKFTDLYANLEFEYFDSANGRKIYKKLYRTVLSYYRLIPKQTYVSFMRNYTNVWLHSGKDNIALEILEKLELESQDLFVEAPEILCVVWNRKAVAYMHLCQYENAMSASRKALASAQKIQSSFWTSITFSDMGHIELNVRAPHKNVSKNIVKYFKQAANLASSTDGLVRELELIQQSSIIHLLNGNFSECQRTAEQGYFICERASYSYFFFRFATLRAYTYIINGNIAMAKQVLMECQSISEIYGLARDWWQVLACNGAIALLTNNLEKAKKIFHASLVAKTKIDIRGTFFEKCLIKNYILAYLSDKTSIERLLSSLPPELKAGTHQWWQQALEHSRQHPNLEVLTPCTQLSSDNAIGINWIF